MIETGGASEGYGHKHEYLACPKARKRISQGQETLKWACAQRAPVGVHPPFLKLLGGQESITRQ